MRAQSRISPDTFRGLAGATIFGYRLDGYDVKTILHRLKRFMTKQGTNGCLAICEVMVHIVAGIALCHKGNMNAFGGVAGLVEHIIWGVFTFASLTNEDI